MNKETLFASMDGIDDELLERSEKAVKRSGRIWKTAAAVAACLCVLVAAWAVFPGLLAPNVPVPDETGGQETLPPPANGNWTVNYIQRDPGDVQTQISGEGTWYQEYLTPEELESVLPENRPAWLLGWGNALFNEDLTPGKVILHLETPVQNASVQVVVSRKALQECVIYPGELSVCNGVEYFVCQYADKNGRVTLRAMGWVKAYWIQFTMTLWSQDLEEGKAAFKDVLESFTYYGESLDWTGITYEYPEDTVQKEIDWEQAKQDAVFGAIIPKEAPEGATFTGGNRYKDANSDKISLTWKTDRRTLRWEVTRYDPRIHKDALASTEDFWRYERETCIFEAEALTKRFVTDGYLAWILQGSWSVKYGDMVITVPRGESNLWVWEQLVALGIVEDEPDYTYREVHPTEWSREPALSAYFPEKIKAVMDRLEDPASYYFYEGRDAAYLEAQATVTEGRKLLRLQVAQWDGVTVPAADTQRYDLTGFDSPWDPDIPEQDRGTMDKPVFEAPELTQEIVTARVYRVRSAPEIRMEFGVRCGDRVVWVFASGYTAEEVYEGLSELKA